MIAVLHRLPRGARTCLLCALAALEPCLHVFGLHTGIEGIAGPLMSAIASDVE